MTVSSELDSEIRQRTADLLSTARSRVSLPPEWDGDAWHFESDSPAARAPLLGGVSFRRAPLDGDGLDLTLTVARTFLGEAADGLALTGQIQLMDTRSRVVGLGPVIRASSERASAVAWILGPASADERLARAALLDLDGLRWQIQYLDDSEHADLVDELTSERDGLVDVINQHFGKRAVKFGSGHRVVRVLNQSLPTKTVLVGNMLSDPIRGRAAYGELSVFSHPTGYLQTINATTWRYQRTHIAYEPTSSVHDEGRLLEPALIAFGRAGASVGKYLGRDFQEEVVALAEGMVGLWNRWCARNGCAPVAVEEDPRG